MAEVSLTNLSVVLTDPPKQGPGAGTQIAPTQTTLAGARGAMNFPILAPSYLPGAVRLLNVQTIDNPQQVFMSFSDAPDFRSPTFLAMVQAPLSTYAPGVEGTRKYLVVGDSIFATRIGNRDAAAVTAVSPRGDLTVRLVWEQDDSVIHAFATNISSDELLKIAESLR